MSSESISIPSSADLIDGWDQKYRQQTTETAWSDEPQAFALWGLDLLNGRPGPPSVIDLGAADGRNSFPYARAGYRVTALDAAPTALKLLLDKFERQQMPPPVAVLGRLEQLPLGSNQFDLALMADVLPQVPQVRRALEESHRILKPGGHLIVNAFTTDDAAFGEGEPVGPRQFLYKGTLFQFFEATDMHRLFGGLFIVEREEKVSWWDPPHPPFRPHRHQHHALAYILRKP